MITLLSSLAKKVAEEKVKLVFDIYNGLLSVKYFSVIAKVFFLFHFIFNSNLNSLQRIKNINFTSVKFNKMIIELPV